MIDSVVVFKWHKDGYRSKFTAEHVNTMRDMVRRNYPHPHRFICITDDPEGLAEGVEHVPLWSDHAEVPNPSYRGGPSCYRRLKVFAPEFEQIAGKRFVVMDLDIVITGDLTPLFSRTEDIVLYRNPDDSTRYNGSMLMMTAGCRSHVWSRFNPRTSPRTSHAAGLKGSDQGWISFVLGENEATWSVRDGIYSFYADFKRNERVALPANAVMTVFHGKPDPWECMHTPWVRRHYRRDDQEPDCGPVSFRSLIMSHHGEKIVVMGGAKTLEREIEGINASVWISVNGHGATLRKPDFVVAMDENHQVRRTPMRQVVRELTDAPIIGPHPHNDYMLSSWPGYPARGLSGMTAAYVADMLGGMPIILAGFDCYGGHERTMRNCEAASKQISGKVRVVDGPLLKFWPKYDPNEKPAPYMTIAEVLMAQSKSVKAYVPEEIRIRIRKPTTIRGEERIRGSEMSVMRHEVLSLLKHRMVEEL